MAGGLPVSRIINVPVNLQPTTTTVANLNTMAIIGTSDVIDVVTRTRTYASLSAIAADFGTSAGEYNAAAVYFGQTPTPASLTIGKWAQTATAGRVVGVPLTAAQQAISNFTGISNGGFKIQVDGGVLTNVTGISLTSVTNLNGVASAINTALTTATLGAVATWDGTRFTIKSSTTGTMSAVTSTVAPTTGVDLGPLIGTNTASNPTIANGIAAESAAAGFAACDSATSFYGVAYAATLADSDTLAIAAAVQGSANKHLFFYTGSVAGILDPNSTTDIAYVLKAGAYTRTFGQYSSTSPYAAVSVAAKQLAVDYTQPGSTITVMFKNEPGVVSESLTATQVSALEAKNFNVFVLYQGGVSIVEPALMAGGSYLDEVAGTDQLALTMQTALFAVLYGANKVPQTDQGNGVLAATIAGVMSQFVINGLIAPGVWGGMAVGTVKTGDTLPTGFYVYQPPVSSQSAPDRSARKSVSFTVLAKLAGAIQSVSAVINVTR